MLGRFFEARTLKAAGAAGALLALGGCTQMTMHSNTLLFGTNTVFGISAGQDANSVPSVTIGYKRQEAVIMPLLANTGMDGGKLTPCPGGISGSTSVPAECLFVSKAKDPQSRDSYSVLASFGAKFDAAGATPGAKGGIAQYFATGLAAQALAVGGGAALVATTEAARTSASNPLNAVAAASLLDDSNAIKEGVQAGMISRSVSQDIAETLGGFDDATFTAKLTSFEKAVGKEAGPSGPGCAGLKRADCIGYIRSNIFGTVPTTTLQAALAAMKQ